MTQAMMSFSGKWQLELTLDQVPHTMKSRYISLFITTQSFMFSVVRCCWSIKRCLPPPPKLKLISSVVWNIYIYMLTLKNSSWWKKGWLGVLSDILLISPLLRKIYEMTCQVVEGREHVKPWHAPNLCSLFYRSSHHCIRKDTILDGDWCFATKYC